MRIARFFVNRTDAQVKNRWLVLKRAGMRAAGIPPPPRFSKKKMTGEPTLADSYEATEEPDSGLIDGIWGGRSDLGDLVLFDDLVWTM
jgi:hypothetical protein